MESSGLERSIDAWYAADPSRKDRFDRVVDGKLGFSLREIDHFVTNMAVRKPVVFVNPSNSKIVDVNSDYRDLLRCYHKAGFDSFKRKGGLETVKQKNFFRWALENGIVDYVAGHVREIERDMIESRRSGGTTSSGGQGREPAQKKPRMSKTSFAIVMQTKEVQAPALPNIAW